jgi:hypothetical protein
MKQVEKIYRSVPFWSWNDKLKKEELVEAYNSVSDGVMFGELWDKIIQNATFSSLPTDYIDGLYNAEYSAAETLAAMYGMTAEEVLKYYGYESKEALRTEIEEETGERILVTIEDDDEWESVAEYFDNEIFSDIDYDDEN